MGARALLLAVSLIPALAPAADLASLAEARTKIEDLDFASALKLLDVALETEGLEREALVEIHELKGICFATLGKVDKAREAFRALLVLDPEHTLGSAQPPRVKTPFYEAKEWAAKAGAVKLEAEPQKAGGDVASLTVRVPPDGLGLARAVAVHVDVNGLRRDEQVALDVSTRAATVKVGAPAFRWWAEVLGDRGAVLLRKGTAEAPNVVEAPKVDKPVAVQLAPQPEPKASPGMGLRVAGAVVGAGGVAALAVGAALGATSADARNRIANAARDDEGNVVGITQRQAAELDAQARNLGAAANVLLIGGGVLAAGGVLMIIFAPTGEVAVAPAPGGAVVSGRF